MQINRSFRAFGPFRLYRPVDQRPDDFDWDNEDSTAANVLEIFRVDMGAGLRAFARFSIWSEGDFPPPPTEAPEYDANLFASNKLDEIFDALINLQPGTGQQSVIFWIHKPDTSGGIGGHALRVMDLIALDRFLPDTGNVELDVLDARTPLRSTYTFNGKPNGSVLTFGSGGNSYDMRLDVAVPLITGQGLDNGVLAFGGTFNTSDGSDANYYRPTATVEGPPDGVQGSTWRVRDLFGFVGATRQRTRGYLEFEDSLQNYGSDIGHTEFLRNLGLNPPHLHGLQSVQILTNGINSSRQAPQIAISMRSEQSRNHNHEWPFLGAHRPRLVAKGIETEIIASCELSDHTIKETFMASREPEEKKPQLTWSLHLMATWTSKLDLYAKQVVDYIPSSDGHFAGGLPAALSASSRARQALVAIQRQPQSILPRLFWRTSADIDLPFISYAQTEIFRVAGELGEAIELSFFKNGFTSSRPVGFVSTLDTEDGKQPRNLNTWLAPRGREWRNVRTLLPQEPVVMELSSLVDRRDTTTPAGGYRVKLGHHSAAPGMRSARSQVLIGVNNDGDNNAVSNPLVARLGSLAMEGGQRLLAENESTEPPGQLRIQSADQPVPDLLPGTESAPALDVEWKLRFGLIETYPETVDIPHGDRASRPATMLIREPVAIPEANLLQTAAIREPLALEVTERLRDDQDRSLNAVLYDTAAGGDQKHSVTVLMDRPFSVYRYGEQPFTDAGSSESSTVAEYDSDTRQWRQRAIAEAYLMTRPPGAVGEDADKPGRLELHDARADGDGPLLPPEDGVARRLVVDMRLSPPSLLWVRPTDLDRNFVLPEYAGRELFRQRGDFGLGVSLAGMRSEALYGLSLGLLVPRERDGQIAPRVAELDALVGQMVPPGDSPSTDRGRRWQDLHDAFRKRPEHLEIWRLDPSAQSPFVPARFEEGLNFALRRTAQLAPPVVDNRVYPVAEKTAPLQPPQFSDRGLSGGVLWPIESANVARFLAETVVGDGGELDRITLSPLGISADQTVSFQGGYARIITETREGRLQKQRVEIMGRIGVLWHRAKHVIIYERTTAPSPQFTPENLGTRSRRAVLRKVSEFIEILEPARRYPDMPGADPKLQGFLREVRFNSKIINVDSAWGRDVGRHGWEVPLWNHAAAERRPQVYPHPDIAFITAAEGRNETGETAQDCRDPHLLFFYTDIEEAKAQNSGTVDTDRWIARVGVDFTAMGKPEVQFDGVTSIKALIEKQLLPGERRPQPSRLSYGLRRYTWRVAPSQTRTVLNAELGKKPVFAGLESVSMMRDVSTAGNVDPAKIEAAVKGADTKGVFEKIVLPRPIEATAEAEFTQIKDLIEEAGSLQGTETAIDDFISNVDGLITDLDTQMQAVRELALGSGAEAYLDSLKSKLDVADSLAAQLVNADSDTCAEWAKRAKSALDRRRLVLMQAVRTVEAELFARLAGQLVITKDTVKDWVNEEVAKEVSGLTADFGGALSGAQDGLAIARSTLADWRADAKSALLRASARVEEAAASLEKAKPWSRDRLDRALTQLASQFDAAAAEAQAALDEAHQRMATELNAEARALSGIVVTTVRSVLDEGANAQGRIGDMQSLLVQKNAQVQSLIERAPDDTHPKVAEMELKATAAGGDVLTAFNTFKGVLTSVRTAKGAAKTTAAEITNQGNAALTTVKVEVRSAMGNVAEAGEDIQSDIADAEDAFQIALDGANAELSELASEIKDEADLVLSELAELSRDLRQAWQDIYDLIDAVVRDYSKLAQSWIAVVDHSQAAGFAATDQWLSRFQRRIDDIQSEMPKLVQDLLKELISDAVNTVIDPLPWPDPSDQEAARRAARAAITDTVQEIDARLKETSELGEAALKPITEACQTLMGAKDKLVKGAQGYLDQLKSEVAAELAELKKLGVEAKELLQAGGDVRDKLKEIATQGAKFSDAIEGATTEFAAAGEHARSYFTGALERADDLFEAKPGELPGKALELISFLSHSPEIAGLRTNADRARVYLDQAKEVLNTPEVQASLDYLGDALKALGLDFKFSEIGDVMRLDGADLGLKDIIKSFSGVNLANLLPDTKLPGDVNKYAKITHDLDTKAGRAWVQADVNADLAGRNKMFSIGPFTLYITRSRLAAFVRAEASKDRPDVQVTDMSRIITDLEAVVGGQVLVTLTDVIISYSRETELDFEIDPSKIKINKSMRFIQDTLGALFPDMPSGMSYLRAPGSGAIVGVEHSFTIPPISLNYGTSGVSNIQIGNRFSLTAYPDFMIANRFNLSRRELPFIFSIFIIGGTGYCQVDTEYRPTDKELMVAVEAGVGGSAALAFSFGPVSGGVYITLSIVLRYAKRLGVPPRPGDGLSVSVVLVIAGQVSLWGMVTIYLGLMLSMTYHESGSIDAMGQLSVELRISRWFKLKFSTQVTYRLRDGQETTTRTDTVSMSGKAAEAVEKLKTLNNARKSL